MNNNYVMHSFNIVSDNAYNLVKVYKDAEDSSVYFNINRSNSSKISEDSNKRFEYIKYIENIFIDPIANSKDKTRDILIIGAGGFTIGLNDKTNNYTYVDIDKSLKDVAEEFFLQKKLLPNKKFIPASARAFIHKNDKKYDLIIIDVYTNMLSIPMESTTRDFLCDIKSLLKENAIVVANIISSADFNDKFTVRYDNTFSSVFPVHTRQALNHFNPWDSSFPYNGNILYIYYNTKLAQDRSIYTDDRNTYSLDRQ